MSARQRRLSRRVRSAVIATLLVVAGEFVLLQAVYHLASSRQALALLATLLVGVSICWFVWFRQLVLRHRTMEHALTEQVALAESEQRLLALIQHGTDLVTVLDADGTASYVSPSSSRMLGTAPESLVGRSIIDLVDPEDKALFGHLVTGLRAGDHVAVELRMSHDDGRTLLVEGMLFNLLTEPTVGGLVLTVRDVTERIAMHERLLQQAFKDELTGLANRQLFADRLAHALRRRDPEPLAVLICDLDDFRSINDSLGHDVGDRVLAEVGRRIARVVRTGDTAARLGGDEFAILMEDTDLPAGKDVAERLLAILSDPVVIDDDGLQLSTSIGLAPAVPGRTTREEVLRNADVAMYWAKDRGKSTVAVYEAVQHARALDQLALRSDLQRALRADELVLHFQPTVELTGETVVGFEALVRWQHPTRGLLSPAAFVPMAEATGLIAPLGRWVLHEACRVGAALQRPDRPLSISVNISARQLDDDGFVEEISRALEFSGLPADLLVLEITESAILHQIDSIAPKLSRLREQHVRIAIDDFGTGYSSLAYLTHLPVDVLKVDKAFIDNVTTARKDASVTEAILAMSRSMDLTTVAEGVELPEQAAWLAAARCALAQGYLWSRPVDIVGVKALLTKPRLARTQIQSAFA